MGKEDYKNEKKGHGFLCVPKELLFDNRYKQLTIEAILLYAYMLDRLKLSIENGWKDSDGKVFIYFSLESIMDLLKCSKGKAISTLKELDEKHGIGLIEKKRSGYGKCSRIYVKEIFSTVILLLLSSAFAFFMRIFFTRSPNVIPDFSLMYFDR